MRTNIDAYILKFHPKFKDISLEERIEYYYSMDNLALKRQHYYLELMESRYPGNTAKDTKTLIQWGSAVSVAGIILVMMTAFRGEYRIFKHYLDDPKNKGKWVGIKAYIKERIIPLMMEIKKEFDKGMLAFIGNRVLEPLSNRLADAIVAMGFAIMFGAREIAHKINKMIIQPIHHYVAKPLYQQVVKPLATTMNRVVIQPLKTHVVTPLIQKVIKPVLQTINKNLIKPANTKIIKPIAQIIHQRFIQPVYQGVVKPVVHKITQNIIKPVYKTVYKYVGKPIYQNIVKPIARPLYTKVIKPLGTFIHQKVIKPIKKWFNKFGKKK